jgi:hypothetical protein
VIEGEICCEVLESEVKLAEDCDDVGEDVMGCRVVEVELELAADMVVEEAAGGITEAEVELRLADNTSETIAASQVFAARESTPEI